MLKSKYNKTKNFDDKFQFEAGIYQNKHLTKKILSFVPQRICKINHF
jgi:hypothetical protein